MRSSPRIESNTLMVCSTVSYNNSYFDLIQIFSIELYFIFLLLIPRIFIELVLRLILPSGLIIFNSNWVFSVWWGTISCGSMGWCWIQWGFISWNWIEIFLMLNPFSGLTLSSYFSLVLGRFLVRFKYQSWFYL